MECVRHSVRGVLRRPAAPSRRSSGAIPRASTRPASPRRGRILRGEFFRWRRGPGLLVRPARPARPLRLQGGQHRRLDDRPSLGAPRGISAGRPRGSTISSISLPARLAGAAHRAPAPLVPGASSRGALTVDAARCAPAPLAQCRLAGGGDRRRARPRPRAGRAATAGVASRRLLDPAGRRAGRTGRYRARRCRVLIMRRGPAAASSRRSRARALSRSRNREDGGRGRDAPRDARRARRAPPRPRAS